MKQTKFPSIIECELEEGVSLVVRASILEEATFEQGHQNEQDMWFFFQVEVMTGAQKYEQPCRKSEGVRVAGVE